MKALRFTIGKLSFEIKSLKHTNQGISYNSVFWLGLGFGRKAKIGISVNSDQGSVIHLNRPPFYVNVFLLFFVITIDKATK